MAKYKFIQDYKTGTYVPPGSQMTARLISFSKDQVVDGDLIVNKSESEPPNFIIINSSNGNVRIPFGGRNGNVIEPIYKSISTTKEQEIQSRDPWTGAIEWNKVFTLRNLVWTLVVMYLIYLFLKHMLPLIKQSIKK